MFSFKKLKRSRVARNAAASYFAFFSTAICGFLSIPVAVAYLSKEQIGLWAVVNSIVTYLIWMDLGVGSATGRKMADAVAAKEQEEIDKWWTATRAALVLQGLIMIAIGLLGMPLFIGFFQIPDAMLGDARVILAGSILIAGFSLPLRGVPGLMTAQERFHWIPLGQGVTPWVQLIVFLLMLRGGWGIKSYVASMAATHLVTWAYYYALIRSSEQKPGWNRLGLETSRFKSLFGFSLNISLMGLIEAVLTSMPNLILARYGGLANVPLYTFTQRASGLITSLVRRTYHAFYPQILRLHVTHQKEEFKRKHRLVGHLMMALALFAAGLVLWLNRTIVVLLAGPDFYAGDMATTWFALAIIITPLSGLFESLLQFSGSMGKSALIGLLKLLLGSAAAYVAYGHFGVAGVAAVFALLPLVYGAYGYFRGARGCGFEPGELSSSVVVHGAMVAGLVLIAGWGMSGVPDPIWQVPIGKRTLAMSGLWHTLIAGTVCSIGAVLGLRTLLALRRA
jgi:O-antigen/teichoic acid export membrane protein